MSGLKEDYLPKYTYEDYKNWEGKWELINGIPFAMSPLPNYRHQKISGNIHIQLSSKLKNCKKCQAMIPMDWRIPDSGDNNVLQPDNFVVCGNIGEQYIETTPVLVFEILSPSTAFKDRNLKFEIYESKGVKYYVIVDSENKYADVYKLIDKDYSKTIQAKDDKVHFDLDDDCKIDFDFKEIWV